MQQQKKKDVSYVDRNEQQDGNGMNKNDQQAGSNTGRTEQKDVSYMDRNAKGGQQQDQSGKKDASMDMKKDPSTPISGTQQRSEESRVNEETGVSGRMSSNNDGAPMDPTDSTERVQQHGSIEQKGKHSGDDSWKDQQGQGGQPTNKGAASSRDQQGNQSNQGGRKEDRRGQL